MKRCIRIRETPEDAAEGCACVVPDPRHRPDWICEHCDTRNDGWRDCCAYCGRLRQDGWD